MSKKSVAVRIAGHDYKILSEGDPAALRKIASHVDQAMDRVRKRTGTVDTLDVSVLTCLNLAREILSLRDQQNESVEEERMRSLVERVEAVLGGEVSARAETADEARVTEAELSEGDASGGSSGEAQGRSQGREPARTLDLPSVEALRDRASAASAASDMGSDESSMPEARVAAGGRERAS